MSESNISIMKLKKSKSDDVVVSKDNNTMFNTKTDVNIENSISFVFKDGLFLADQSDLSLLPKEVLICPFNLVVNWLQGIFIYIPENCIIKQPIHLKCQTSYNKETPCYLRHTIVLKESSQVTLIEEYTGIPTDNLFTSSHIQEKTGIDEKKYYSYSDINIELGKNAILNYYKLQDESGHVNHEAHVAIQQHELSHATLFFTDCGAQSAKTSANVCLQKPYAVCQVYGLYRTHYDAQRIHHHIDMNHAADHTKSTMQFKGILDKKSEANFIGKVSVHNNTRHIHARQANHHMLLSEHAKVTAKPELEIHADDLTCSHGATVGQLDDDALFYLRSRGIEKNLARQLLIQAFVDDLLNKMDDPMIRYYINKRISHYETV